MCVPLIRCNPANETCDWSPSRFTLPTPARDPAESVPARPGFTLVELLVVIVIIALLSAITLPVVIPALRHRQVSEGARALQGALVGARSSAIRTQGPSGIRLLPDPAFPLRYLPDGSIDPAQPLAANRIIPIEAAPPYSVGRVNIVWPTGPGALAARPRTIVLPPSFAAAVQAREAKRRAAQRGRPVVVRGGANRMDRRDVEPRAQEVTPLPYILRGRSGRVCRRPVETQTKPRAGGQTARGSFIIHTTVTGSRVFFRLFLASGLKIYSR